MPYVGKKPADIIATAVDTTTGTFSGEVDAASLDISGDIDVDGTTNLDAVDIDGAVDMASTLGLDGALSAKGGAVFNENSADVDFRVESNDDANIFRIEGATNNVKIGSNAGNYGQLSIKNEKAGSQERGLYVEVTPASGTSPNNVAVFSATNSNMTQPLVRIHHESPTADQLLLQATTTGSNTVKFSVDEDGDIYSAGGINLGGTGSANKLDDYEEGTFTPAWTSSGSSFQYSSQQGIYTKIGNRVCFTIYVQLDGGGNSFSSNAVTLGGFPFTSSETMYYPVLGRFLNSDAGSGYYDPCILLNGGGTSAALRQLGDNVGGVASAANVLSSSSGQVWISGTYRTDS